MIITTTINVEMNHKKYFNYKEEVAHITVVDETFQGEARILKSKIFLPKKSFRVKRHIKGILFKARGAVTLPHVATPLISNVTTLP